MFGVWGLGLGIFFAHLEDWGLVRAPLRFV